MGLREVSVPCLGHEAGLQLQHLLVVGTLSGHAEAGPGTVAIGVFSDSSSVQVSVSFVGAFDVDENVGSVVSVVVGAGCEIAPDAEGLSVCEGVVDNSQGFVVGQFPDQIVDSLVAGLGQLQFLGLQDGLSSFSELQALSRGEGEKRH